MKRTALVILLAALPSLAACSESKKAAPGAGGKVQYDCTIMVAAKLPPGAQPITGSATDADEAKATEAAWQDACKKLPPDEQPACRDPSRYQSSLAVGKADKVTVTVTITPAPPPQVEGKGSSAGSQEAACHTALLEACQKAGGQGDCVTAGTHEKKGEMTSRTMKP